MKKEHSIRAIVLLAVVAMTLLGASCATSIAVTVTKPSEIDLRGAKTIAVLPIGIPSDGYVGLDAFRSALSRYWDGYRFYASDIDLALAKKMNDSIISVLVDSGYFRVVSAFDLGRILGRYRSGEDITADVDVFLVAEFTKISFKDKDETLKEKDKEGNIILTPQLTRTAEVAFTYRIVSARDGSIIATKTKTGTDYARATGDKRWSRIDDYGAIADRIGERFMREVAREIAPYTVTEFRTLVADETKDPRMAEADKLVKERMYAKALDIFKAVYAENLNFAAGFNAGILIEITGDLEAAIAWMQDLYAKSGDSRAANELTRMKKTLADLTRLESM